MPRTAAAAALALGLAGLAVAGPSPAPTPAAAAPGAGITITPNPWYASEPFDGWGTSLVWFANAIGAYPDELRQQLYDLVFSEAGLDLNVARYNIGGGNSSDTPSYLRLGGAVPGYWAPDPDGGAEIYGGVSTSYADRAALAAVWDPQDPTHFDWTQDAGQRWWLEQFAETGQVTKLEAFANSAPYFLTASGYTSGGTSSTAENLPTTALDQFAGYLVKVVEHLEDQYGLEFDTIDPFNEPNTNYWSTTLTGGVPTGGRQEGMHVGTARQAAMIQALRLALDGAETEAVISAMDETNPGTFMTNWNSYSAAVKEMVGQMNVHTYGTSSRLQVRDASKTADKPLYMSEIEGDWAGSGGFNPQSMANAFGLAGRIADDLRELEPDAWVLWQPVEDLYNMDGAYTDSENLNWGSLYIDFDCQYYGEEAPENFKSARRVAQAGSAAAVEPCHIMVNSKFNAMRNYSNFIRPGDSLIAVDNSLATAAVNAAGDALTVVYTNSGTSDAAVTVDLAGFAAIEPDAAATAYVSTQPTGSTLAQVQAAGVVPQTPVAVDQANQNVTLTLPAQSIASIVVEGVSGVSAQATGPRDGETYLLKGKASGRYLGDGGDPEAANQVQIQDIGATSEEALAQAWTFHQVDTSAWNEPAAKAFALQNTSGEFLTASSAGTSLDTMAPAEALANPNATWIASTANGFEFSLLNKALGTSLEVNGQASAAGSPVGVYTFSGGAHQYWTLGSTKPTSTEAQVVATAPGVAPELPATARPVYEFGPGSPSPVTWEELPAETWGEPGAVEVAGAGVDVFGNSYPALVTVLVGQYGQTEPVRIKVPAGSTAAAVEQAAPATAEVAVGDLGRTVEAPVTWDFSQAADSDFADVGALARIGGLVASNVAGSPDLPVWLLVITQSGSTVDNLCPRTNAGGHVSSVAAHYTEGSASANNTCDGSLTTNWSNWRSSGYTSGTLTYTLDALYWLSSVAVVPYERSPLSVTIEVNPNSSGNDGWVETSAGTVGGWTNDTEKAVAFKAVQARRVRLSMTFDHYVKIAEVKLTASPQPNAVAALADLRLDGVPLEGFDPATLAYQVEVDPAASLPAVSGIAADAAAAVEVAQAGDPDNPEAVVAQLTVTAEDGQTQAVYTVVLAPPVDKSFLAAAVAEVLELDQADYTAPSWLALQQALASAQAALGSSEASQSQVDAALEALTAAVDGLERALPQLDVDVAVSVRCIAAKPILTVTAANGEAGPLGIEIATDYGVKAFAAVASGKYGAHAFTTRLPTLPAGQVVVRATAPANADGEPVVAQIARAYAQHAC
ncbi:MAG: RICIN domain-containing protein [Bifidobacteriaceae bacterium]|nr:RICIN domain-containing protein [Bifidobacteriaceae bacterium]